MSNYTEGDIVEVRCVDIVQNSSWRSLDTIRRQQPPRIKAVGYFLKETDEYIILLAMYLRDDGDEDAGYMLFPKGIVKSIERIQESELNDFD